MTDSVAVGTLIFRFSLIGRLLLALSVIANASELLSVRELNARYTCAVLHHLAADTAFLHSAHLSSNDERIASEIVGEAARKLNMLGKALDRHLVSDRESQILRDNVLDQTRAQLDTRLSTPGWLRLTSFIETDVIRLIREANQPQVLV